MSDATKRPVNVSGEQCKRCGDTINHGHGDRFRFSAWDFAESSGAIYEGGLCRSCWGDLVEFLQGDRLEGALGLCSGGVPDA